MARFGRAFPLRAHLTQPAPAAKAATLADSFLVNDLAVLWPGTAGTVTWSPGKVAVKADTSYDSLLATAAAYDLTGSAVFARISPYLATSSQTYLQLAVGPPAGATSYIAAGQAGATSFFNYVIAGTTTYAYSAAYAAVNHAWYRVRESAGTVYFDAAPDGVTWANLYSVSDATLTFALAALTVAVRGGDYGADAPGTSYVSGFSTATLLIPSADSGTAAPMASPVIRVSSGDAGSKTEPPGMVTVSSIWSGAQWIMV